MSRHCNFVPRVRIRLVAQAFMLRILLLVGCPKRFDLFIQSTLIRLLNFHHEFARRAVVRFCWKCKRIRCSHVCSCCWKSVSKFRRAGWAGRPNASPHKHSYSRRGHAVNSEPGSTEPSSTKVTTPGVKDYDMEEVADNKLDHENDAPKVMSLRDHPSEENGRKTSAGNPAAHLR